MEVIPRYLLEILAQPPIGDAELLAQLGDIKGIYPG